MSALRSFVSPANIAELIEMPFIIIPFIIAPSEEGLAKLRLKHPPATVDPCTLPVPQPDSCLSVVEADVRKAIVAGTSSWLIYLWMFGR